MSTPAASIQLMIIVITISCDNSDEVVTWEGGTSEIVVDMSELKVDRSSETAVDMSELKVDVGLVKPIM